MQKSLKNEIEDIDQGAKHVEPLLNRKYTIYLNKKISH